MAKLQSHTPQLVLGVYKELVAEFRRRGITPVWVYAPMPGVVEPGGQKAELFRVAGRAGFEVVDLSGWDEGYRPAEVKLGTEDHHPNALGQRLIAGRLFEAARRRPVLVGGARP